MEKGRAGNMTKDLITKCSDIKLLRHGTPASVSTDDNKTTPTLGLGHWSGISYHNQMKN